MKFLIVFVAGMAAGYAVSNLSHSRGERKKFIEKREKGYRYISPLLECDIASNILSNQELIPFKQHVEKRINECIDKKMARRISLYFRELNDGIWFSVGETDQFVPASMRKLPLMVALFKMSEQPGMEKLLNTKYKVNLANDYNLQQNLKPAVELIRGESYTVMELINRMIIYSDNNAFFFLTRIVSPIELEKVYSLLRMPSMTTDKDDQFQSVQTFSSFFRILYNASYLSKHNSELALSILAKSDFKAGIIEGVPQSVPVAHKFGEKSLNDKNNRQVVQLHDCGIVYYPNNPYILCMMSEGENFQTLDDVIREASNIVFKEVDSQMRRRGK